MKTGSRKILHLGINFVTVPKPILSQQKFLLFQQAILNSGLDFSKAESDEEKFQIIRESPSPLRITVVSQNQPVGQLIVIAPNPKTPISLFIEEVSAVVQAFNSVWSDHNRKIIAGDATIRELLPTETDHAFQELWEKRLGQKGSALSVFGRPVRGGGLRFVLESEQDAEEISNIEVKIESYLRDTSKIYLEAQSKWRYNKDKGTFEVEKIVSDLNAFIVSKVHKFLGGNDVSE